MESRQGHIISLGYLILSIQHVVFCQTTQSGGCTYSLRPFAHLESSNRNCNSNTATSKSCEPGKLTLGMNLPCSEDSSIKECQSSNSRPCRESCASCQPVTKLVLLPNQPCSSSCSPSVSCSPSFATFSSASVPCCSSFPNFGCQRSLPSVIEPPQVPVPQPLCLKTSFPLPNIGIVQPDPTIAQCNDADFEDLVSECWNDIPRLQDLAPLPCCSRGCGNNCQVPVLLQISSQQGDCGSASAPQIIYKKSSSKLRKLLPIIMIAMMAGDNNNCNNNCSGGGVVPVPIPIPIPYNYAN